MTQCHGEVNIYQEYLYSFLEAAQNLEIPGLIGHINEERNDNKDDNLTIGKTQAYVPKINAMFEEEEVKVSDNTTSNLVNSSDTDDNDVFKQGASTNDVVTRIYVGNTTPEEIEVKTKELYQKIEGVLTCLHCGKTSGQISNIKFHVETHMDGLCYTCNICNKAFKNKKTLHTHISKLHKQRLSELKFLPVFQ